MKHFLAFILLCSINASIFTMSDEQKKLKSDLFGAIQQGDIIAFKKCTQHENFCSMYMGNELFYLESKLKNAPDKQLEKIYQQMIKDFPAFSYEQKLKEQIIPQIICKQQKSQERSSPINTNLLLSTGVVAVISYGFIWCSNKKI